MGGGPDGVTHVVQAVEARDQVVAVAAEVGRTGRFEPGAISDAGFVGRDSGLGDGRLVIVEPSAMAT